MKTLLLFLFLFPTLAYCQTEAGTQTANLEKSYPIWQPKPVLKDSLRKFEVSRKSKNKTKLRKILKIGFYGLITLTIGVLLFVPYILVLSNPYTDGLLDCVIWIRIFDNLG